MAKVLPNNSEEKIMSAKEAKEFFEQAVRERLNVSAEEFLKNTEAFKSNPNYDSLMFLVPLIDGSK